MCTGVITAGRLTAEITAFNLKGDRLLKLIFGGFEFTSIELCIARSVMSLHQLSRVTRGVCDPYEL